MTDTPDRPADRPNDLLIYDSCRPVHPADTKLSVNVGQSLSGGQSGGSQRLTLASNVPVHLRVEGPQVRLQPEDVIGVYPAPGSDDSPPIFLPHLVLSRRTLPWERHGPLPVGGGSPTPWLALILVDERELPGGNGPRDTSVGALADVDKLGHAAIAATGLADSTQVTVIDLPRALVRKILPETPNGLRYLTHMRRLISDSPLKQLDDDGDVAVVIGARLPHEAPQGEKPALHHAFLVSLEGRNDLFTEPATTTSTRAKATATRAGAATATRAGTSVPRLLRKRASRMRVVDSKISNNLLREHAAELVKLVSTSLIVLHHWTFTPAAGGADFESVVKSIRYRPNGGVLRFGKLPRVGKDVPLQSIVAGQGQLDEALVYPQALAGAAVYRGPLAPNKPKHRQNVFAVRSRPEELIGTDAPQNAVEQSELAAFELGRLLALSDPNVLASMQTIQPQLVLPDIPDYYEVDPRPAALRFPDTVINPGPEHWNDVVNKWVNPLNQQSLIKASRPLTDLGGMGLEPIEQDALVEQLRTRLQQLAGQVPEQGIDIGIDIDQLDPGHLVQMFPGLSNRAN